MANLFLREGRLSFLNMGRATLLSPLNMGQAALLKHFQNSSLFVDILILIVI